MKFSREIRVRLEAIISPRILPDSYFICILSQFIANNFFPFKYVSGQRSKPHL